MVLVGGDAKTDDFMTHRVMAAGLPHVVVLVVPLLIPVEWLVYANLRG